MPGAVLLLGHSTASADTSSHTCAHASADAFPNSSTATDKSDAGSSDPSPDALDGLPNPTSVDGRSNPSSKPSRGLLSPERLRSERLVQ